jgi:hypothetical protein
VYVFRQIKQEHTPMPEIILWKEWTQAFSELRLAFSRQATFLWAMTICAAMAVRTDTSGVTSLVRALGLSPRCYHRILAVIHSRAIDLDRLGELWVGLLLKLCIPACVDGYLLLIADGISVGKEGKKMPAVQSLHQSSSSNCKAEFIMGHFLQAVSLVVWTPLKTLAAIPLTARIHLGLVTSNRSQKTIVDRMAHLVNKLARSAGHPAIVIADAYYAVAKMADQLLAEGNHLVTRLQRNAVAFELPIPRIGRGRPRKFGEKVTLSSLYPLIPNEGNRIDGYRYITKDLLWRPLGRLVRFVLVINDQGGKATLMSTNLNLNAETIIRLYANRWAIEVGFKSALRTIGTFSYHFWMKGMEPIKRRSTGQHLHRKSQEYRDQVSRKMQAFHAHIQLGCIAQGLSVYLATHYPSQVWSSFGGWLRTMRKNQQPSEAVVGQSLRTGLEEYLQSAFGGGDWEKFIKKMRLPLQSGKRKAAA